VIRTWLREQPGSSADPLFPTRTGRRLSPDAVQDLVERHAVTAAAGCPSIRYKHVTPHTLRHYVDGWVMWLAAASPLVAEPRLLVPAT
jgi:integrase